MGVVMLKGVFEKVKDVVKNVSVAFGLVSMDEGVNEHCSKVDIDLDEYEARKKSSADVSSVQRLG